MIFIIPAQLLGVLWELHVFRASHPDGPDCDGEYGPICVGIACNKSCHSITAIPSFVNILCRYKSDGVYIINGLPDDSIRDRYNIFCLHLRETLEIGTRKKQSYP